MYFNVLFYAFFNVFLMYFLMYSNTFLMYFLMYLFKPSAKLG